MSTNRRLSLILGAVLALILIGAWQVYQFSSTPTPGSQPYTGMGEWRRFEVQQAQGGRTIAGIGDLRRFEAEALIIPVTGGSGSSLPIAGMGNLRRFEVEQQSIPLNIGMGNLRRFEGEPTSQNTPAQQSSLPVTIAALPRSNHTDKVSTPGDPPAKGPGR
jgi:hypothetical protein